MILTITIARKPVVGTVAQNVLRYGVGGLNVDVCRVTLEANCRLLKGGTYVGNRGSNKGLSIFGTNTKGLQYDVPNPSGRWPANLILSHLPGCTQTGVADVKTDTHYPSSRGISPMLTGHTGQSDLVESKPGKETVDKWECQEGCPCSTFSTARSAYPGRQDLADAHTGTPIKYSAVIDIGGSLCGKEYADSGSASRFFKQIQEEEE